MLTVGLIVLLIAAFYALGKAADLVVTHIRHVGQALGIGVFFLGLLLGLFTSTPELALGLNSYASGVPSLSLGNLIGGIPVLIGLVLGGSLILNRRISTKGKDGMLPFTLAYLCLPLLLGLDGQIGIIDGTVLILFYLLLVYALYSWHRSETGLFVQLARRRMILADIFLTFSGILGVLVVSSIIVRITLHLLAMWSMPPFIVGLLVFSIGTNLPEITVMFRSWRQGNMDLSISHLLGSAIVNPLLIGIFSFIEPTALTVSLEYYALVASFVLLLAVFYLFYKSDEELTRREGIMLILCYVVYLVGQVISIAG